MAHRIIRTRRVSSRLSPQKNKSVIATLLEIHLVELGLREFVTEYEFHKTPGEVSLQIFARFDAFRARGWRFDYAFPDIMVAIEIEGGVWTGGRHTRGCGFQDDLDKYNVAAAIGWRLFRFSTQDINEGKALAILRAYLFWRSLAV